jgi:hypothetical protein
MALGMLLGEYIAWHYTLGIVEVARAWANIHLFLLNYFSIPTLLQSLFAPFHRIHEQRVRGFDPENLMEVFIVNSLMRVVGAVVRLAVILVGLIAQVLAFVAGSAFFLLFVAAPVSVLACIIIGVAFLFP